MIYFVTGGSRGIGAAIVLQEFPVNWLRLKLSKPGAVRGSSAVGVIIEREPSSLRLPG